MTQKHSPGEKPTRQSPGKKPARHPPGKCRGTACWWCYPTENKARVEVRVVATIDLESLTRDLGLNDMKSWDTKIWLQDDIEVLIRKLPYLDHMSDVSVTATGLSEQMSRSAERGNKRKDG